MSLIEHRIGGHPSYFFSQKMESQTYIANLLREAKSPLSFF